MADGSNIIHLHPVAALDHPMRNAFGFPDVEPVERYDLRGWANGYAIYDNGDLICTFHGPQWDLASATLRRLREDAEAA